MKNYEHESDNPIDSPVNTAKLEVMDVSRMPKALTVSAKVHELKQAGSFKCLELILV